MRTSHLIAASVALHVGGFTMISRKAREIEKKQTLIEVVEKQKQEEQKKAEPPPKPIEASAEVLRPKALAPAAPEAEAAPSATPSPQMQALPDVGTQSAPATGGGGGGEGTLPTGNGTGGGGGGGGKPVEKTLGTPKPAAANPDLAEDIAAWKPKPVARVKPVYPDDARAAEIEGTVTVEALIDCTGKVVSAQVTKKLGHGLDDAALVAVKKTEFAPAPKCAPGLQKTVKINYAFRLGD